MGHHIVHDAPLADVRAIKYWTFHGSTSTDADAVATFVLRADIDGDLATTDDETELVYDPRANTPVGPSGPQPVAPNVWQFWDATNGAWTVTSRISCGDFVVEPGGGANGVTTPAAVAANCPNAAGVAFGARLGPSAAGNIVGVDGILFATTDGDFTWDFGPK